MVAHGPDIDMSPEEELRARSEALKGAVQVSAAAGLRDPHVERLREVIGRHWKAFRRGLRRGDLPMRVEPLRVILKLGTRPVNSRPRVYNPTKTAWVTACMASLAVLGLVFLNLQAVWASAAMAAPKTMLSDFRAANQQVEKVPGVASYQETSIVKLSEARFYGSPDLLQGYRQSPLAPDVQKIFTITTPGGLYVYE